MTEAVMNRRLALSLGLTVAAVASQSATAGSVAPGRGCGTTLAYFPTQPYRRTVVTPPSPGLSATRLGNRVRLRWSFAYLPKECRPQWLLLSLRDGGSNTPAFTPDAFKIVSQQGTHDLTPPAFMKPLWALASAFDAHGSRSTVVRVRISG